MVNKPEKVWCVVAAAGIGSRMQSAVPKQYLPLGSSTVLDATLERLLLCEKIEHIVVCIHQNDNYWQHSKFAHDDRISIMFGGSERADSVLNGVSLVKEHADLNDWVLVHDAARPCVRCSDINVLINTALKQQVGAILATPIHDTVKKVVNKKSTQTLDRSILWRALTPQIFKLDMLNNALINAIESNRVITDEASAIEQMNQAVQIVKGHADNIKITSPSDLDLARYYLEQQERQVCA